MPMNLLPQLIKLQAENDALKHENAVLRGEVWRPETEVRMCSEFDETAPVPEGNAEQERLRRSITCQVPAGELEDLRSHITKRLEEAHALNSSYFEVLAERDSALSEVERLRAEGREVDALHAKVVALHLSEEARLQAQRDELAEALRYEKRHALECVTLDRMITPERLYERMTAALSKLGGK